MGLEADGGSLGDMKDAAANGFVIRVLLLQSSDVEQGAMERLLAEVQTPPVVLTRHGDLAAARECLAQAGADVVLLQLGLCGGDVRRALHAIGELAPRVPVILFGSLDEEPEGLDALGCGAVDYLVMDTLTGAAMRRVLRYSTARAGLEKSLRNSEQRYRALFEHAGTAMLFVENGVVQAINGRAEAVFGCTRLEVEGRTPWIDLFPAHERARIEQSLEASSGGEPAQFETHPIGCPGEERTLLANVVGIPGTRGHIVSLTDLTAREVAEAETRRQRQYFRALFENSPEGIVALDGDGRVVDANPAFEKLFGFTREELAGRDVIDFVVAPRHAEDARSILDRTLTTGSRVSHALRRRSDGTEIEVSILGAPVVLDGVRAGGFGIYRDMSAEREARERLEEAFIDLVETTSRMMESVDPYTAAHQRMVARIGDVVGRKLGLSDDRLQGLYVGALLHDVGKLSLPSTILTKPGKLSPQEWALIRSHSRRGYEVLLDANLPWPVANMALRHHERLDGSGYPDGVSGDSLSLELRILNVCDVVEAMSADRPYRPGLPVETVVGELQSGLGVRYDRDVVEAVLHVIRGGEITLGTGYESAR